MFDKVVDDVFRSLGEGHRYAPGEEPAFFEKALAWMYSYEIRWVEVLWFLAFVILIYAAFRVLRFFWLLTRPRRRTFDREEIDAEIEDERARRHRLLLRKRMAADGKLDLDEPRRA